MDDARFVRKVMGAAEPLVAQPLGSPIRRGSNGTPSSAARDDLCREMIDRHDRNDLRPKARDVGTTYKRALLRYRSPESFALSIFIDRARHGRADQRCLDRKSTRLNSSH